MLFFLTFGHNQLLFILGPSGIMGRFCAHNLICLSTIFWTSPLPSFPLTPESHPYYAIGLRIIYMAAFKISYPPPIDALENCSKFLIREIIRKTRVFWNKYPRGTSKNERIFEKSRFYMVRNCFWREIHEITMGNRPFWSKMAKIWDTKNGEKWRKMA